MTAGLPAAGEDPPPEVARPGRLESWSEDDAQLMRAWVAAQDRRVTVVSRRAVRRRLRERERAGS